MKIYMDNCCYNRPYDDQTHIRIHLETEVKLHIQDMVKKQGILWSLVSKVQMHFMLPALF